MTARKQRQRAGNLKTLLYILLLAVLVFSVYHGIMGLGAS